MPNDFSGLFQEQLSNLKPLEFCKWIAGLELGDQRKIRTLSPVLLQQGLSKISGNECDGHEFSLIVNMPLEMTLSESRNTELPALFRGALLNHYVTTHAECDLYDAFTTEQMRLLQQVYVEASQSPDGLTSTMKADAFYGLSLICHPESAHLIDLDAYNLITAEAVNGSKVDKDRALGSLDWLISAKAESVFGDKDAQSKKVSDSLPIKVVEIDQKKGIYLAAANIGGGQYRVSLLGKEQYGFYDIEVGDNAKKALRLFAAEDIRLFPLTATSAALSMLDIKSDRLKSALALVLGVNEVTAAKAIVAQEVTTHVAAVIPPAAPTLPPQVTNDNGYFQGLLKRLGLKR